MKSLLKRIFRKAGNLLLTDHAQELVRLQQRLSALERKTLTEISNVKTTILNSIPLKVTECCYYEPINFLKITLQLGEQVCAGGGGVYRENEQIGSLKLLKMVKEGYEYKYIYSFFHTFEEALEEDSLSVEIDGKRRALFLERVNSLPPNLVSFIGQRTMRIVEDAYYKKQLALQLKPNLITLGIESSSRCNMRCKSCLIGDNYGQIERGLISDEVVEKVIEILRTVKTITFIKLNALGESLLYPGFAQLLKRISKETQTRPLLHFFTNGMLFTKELADAIASIPSRFEIYFSIDGATPEENDDYRKGSNYEKIKENLGYLLQKTKAKENFAIKVNNLQIKGEEIYPPAFLLNDFGHLKIDSHRPYIFPKLQETFVKKNKMSISKSIEKVICRRVFEETTVRYNGDLIRCHWDSSCEEVMGNILKDDIMSLWHGEKYIKHRELMSPTVPYENLPPVCQHCHVMLSADNKSGYYYSDQE